MTIYCFVSKGLLFYASEKGWMDMYCNACGRELKMEQGLLMEDAFEAKKQWGYFSEKDTQIHSFVLCEKCYDKMVQNFVYPPEVSDVTEL